MQTAINCDAFWLQSFGSRNSSLANKKNYVTVPFLLCFTSYLRAISKYKVPGAYIRRGDYTEGFFALRVLGGGGAYLWRGLFSEFYGTASQSRKILQTFIRGAHKLSPHHASVCKFSQLCMAISSLA